MGLYLRAKKKLRASRSLFATFRFAGTPLFVRGEGNR